MNQLQLIIKTLYYSVLKQKNKDLIDTWKESYSTYTTKAIIQRQSQLKWKLWSLTKTVSISV